MVSNVILRRARAFEQPRIFEILRRAQKDKGLRSQNGNWQCEGQSVSSLTKLFDHIGAFQTITKRTVILPGTDTAKH